MKFVLYPLAVVGAAAIVAVATAVAIGRAARQLDDDDLIAQLRRLPPPPLNLREDVIRLVEAVERYGR